jgi:hypothetical protein
MVLGDAECVLGGTRSQPQVPRSEGSCRCERGTGGADDPPIERDGGGMQAGGQVICGEVPRDARHSGLQPGRCHAQQIE